MPTDLRRACVLLALALSGCPSRSGTNEVDAGTPSSAPTPTTSASSVKPPPAVENLAPRVREGSSIATGRARDALYVADEDHAAIDVIPLPFDPAKPARKVPMPGAPAQVVAVSAERVLVTVRDPGLLLVLRPDPAAGLVEVGRVALPADAWGIAITADARTAIVTSAWTHQISLVDLATLKVRWSVDAQREPRGVVIREVGGGGGAVAYVTHLIGAGLTRIDDLAGTPRVSRVELPASPLRAPSGRSLAASLGYAAALTEDGSRLFVARHALGALGKEAWFGAATVDVMTTANDTGLAPRHQGLLPFLRADKAAQGDEVRLPGGALAPFTQPRAIVYRKSTRTVLVVGEGDDRVVELDALAMDPTLAVLRTYAVGAGYDPVMPVATSGAAPQGIALSEDESTAWVFCRASYDVVELPLSAIPEPVAAAPATTTPLRVLHLGDDPVDAFVGIGRRLFYNASDHITSGGVGCAGCHPDGRDDGFVWHEAKFNSADGTSVNFVGSIEQVPEEDHVKGSPRRTPMLAGRVAAAGPYGWHAESPTLEDRLGRGFGLHRWGALPKHEAANLAARAGYVIAYLRKGLATPPRDEHPATPQEQRGRAIFTSPEAKCTRCHVPDSGYTDRSAYPFKRPKLADFDDDPVAEFKTPSLLFVGGHAPYFHDGSAASLDELIERNADRMGQTSQLSKDDRAALVAFLKTL